MASGIYKRKKEHLFKMKKVGFQKGMIPWNKNKSWNEEMRLKMSTSHLGKSSGNKGKHHKHSEEAKRKISESHKGEKAYQWIKDRTKLKKSERHADSAYLEWVKNIKNRDNWKCKIGNKDCNGILEAHHILAWRNYPELRYEINNGITLCKFHHPRKKSEEERLSPFFQQLILDTN